MSCAHRMLSGLQNIFAFNGLDCGRGAFLTAHSGYPIFDGFAADTFVVIEGVCYATFATCKIL